MPLQDWLIPQLYHTGADPALVPATQAVAPDAHRRPRRAIPLPGFPPAPRYRFHGRARELLRLERLLLGHPAVLLHAGGGMSKTALAREAVHWWRRTGRFDLALFHSLELAAGAEAVASFQPHRVLLVWDNFESVLPAWSAHSAPR